MKVSNFLFIGALFVSNAGLATSTSGFNMSLKEFISTLKVQANTGGATPQVLDNIENTSLKKFLSKLKVPEVVAPQVLGIEKRCDFNNAGSFTHELIISNAEDRYNILAKFIAKKVATKNTETITVQLDYLDLEKTPAILVDTVMNYLNLKGYGLDPLGLIYDKLNAL
jgi:hypothetical protein